MTPTTPRAMGYRMPAEWEPHEATWLAWPHDPITWPDRVPQVEEIFLDFCQALAPHERVELLVKDEDLLASVPKRLRARGVDEGRVRLHLVPTADSWIRDYGPIFLTRPGGPEPKLAATDWIFNAWGGKYDALLPDDDIPQRIRHLFPAGTPLFEPGIVMEGGSLDVNGAGTVLTTEQCLLNKNRNPKLSREDIEGYLRDYLGVSNVLWLGDGIEGDDTDGHVDDITRFVGPRKVVTVVEEDVDDANHAPLAANLELLRGMTDQDGRKLEIATLPMPDFVGDEEGRLPASYANFYIANNVVLAPVFGHDADAEAVDVLRKLFPTRKIAPINCEPLVWGFGAIHCVTQQQPKV